MWIWSFSDVKELRDKFKIPDYLSSCEPGLILEWEAEKSTCLIELDVRKPFVASIPRRSERGETLRPA